MYALLRQRWVVGVSWLSGVDCVVKTDKQCNKMYYTVNSGKISEGDVKSPCHRSFRETCKSNLLAGFLSNNSTLLIPKTLC